MYISFGKLLILVNNQFLIMKIKKLIISKTKFSKKILLRTSNLKIWYKINFIFNTKFFVVLVLIKNSV